LIIIIKNKQNQKMMKKLFGGSKKPVATPQIDPRETMVKL